MAGMRTPRSSGSAGCQPAFVGNLPTKLVLGRMPSTTGQWPVLPRIGQSRVWFFTISKLNWPVFDRPSRDLNVVKGDRVIGKLLVSFVTFAGD